MEKPGSRSSIFKPFLAVFFLALVSYLVYYGSRRVGNQSLHQALAAIFGTIYFMLHLFRRPVHLHRLATCAASPCPSGSWPPA